MSSTRFVLKHAPLYIGIFIWEVIQIEFMTFFFKKSFWPYLACLHWPKQRTNRQNKRANWFRTRRKVLIKKFTEGARLEPVTFSTTKARLRRSDHLSHTLTHLLLTRPQRFGKLLTVLSLFKQQIKIKGTERIH